ncbi:MAG: hypothetical protein DMF64_21940 [Acidobacteria bacterium]|nr:MAG: hypothetical protein DMF64_21940 [Acidobacteriota bacterium]
MIKLDSPDQLANATKHAQESNLFVQPTSMFRQYRVTDRDNGHGYLVDFFVRNGKRFGHCTCKAGQHNMACKHLSAAAALHACRAAERQAA